MIGFRDSHTHTYIYIYIHCQFGSRCKRSSRVNSIPYCMIRSWMGQAPVVSNRKTERLMRMIKTKSVAPQMTDLRRTRVQVNEGASDYDVIATAAPRDIQEYR